jgi:hypothetical protein
MADDNEIKPPKDTLTPSLESLGSRDDKSPNMIILSHGFGTIKTANYTLNSQTALATSCVGPCMCTT